MKGSTAEGLRDPDPREPAVHRHRAEDEGKTGGNNAQRLLIVAGYSTDFKKTCAPAYKLPKDTIAGRMFISVHYYTPYQFAASTRTPTGGR